MTTSALKHSLNVTDTQIVGVPRVVKEFNQFDEHGSLIGLSRLRGERNWEYRRRLFDTFANIANSSYRGLVNGITRELGLTTTEVMNINPKVDINGTFLAPDPYIKFDGVSLFLYSDFANGILDYKIDRYEPGGNHEHLGRLVDFINTTSFFEANIQNNTDRFTRSMTILNQSNRDIVSFERLPISTKFTIENDRLVPGTVFFSNKTIFRTEVQSELTVTSRGDYYIDYHSGIVRTFLMPKEGDFVRYQYTKYPFKALASPVILHDINSDNFKIKMFEQVLQDDGTLIHGLPTEIGVDIINKLLLVSPMYWGV